MGYIQRNQQRVDGKTSSINAPRTFEGVIQDSTRSKPFHALRQSRTNTAKACMHEVSSGLTHIAVNHAFLYRQLSTYFEIAFGVRENKNKNITQVTVCLRPVDAQHTVSRNRLPNDCSPESFVPPPLCVISVSFPGAYKLIFEIYNARATVICQQVKAPPLSLFPRGHLCYLTHVLQHSKPVWNIIGPEISTRKGESYLTASKVKAHIFLTCRTRKNHVKSPSNAPASTCWEMGVMRSDAVSSCCHLHRLPVACGYIRAERCHPTTPSPLKTIRGRQPPLTEHVQQETKQNMN